MSVLHLALDPAQGLVDGRLVIAQFDHGVAFCS
jgi:hypothetical protein